MFRIQHTSVGLDISDESIEVVALQKKGRKFLVTAKNRIRLPEGLVESGVVQDEKKLGEIITGLFASATPEPITYKQIVFALPDSQVYTHTVRLTDVKKRDVEEHLPKALARIIPIPEDQLIFSWRTVEETKEYTDVLAVVAERRILIAWQNFFASIGFTFDAFDIESLALFRDIFAHPPKTPVCIVDIGARTVQYSFFDAKGLRYTQLGHIAGNYFTEALHTVFEDIGAAEKYKRNTGLDAGDKKAQTALLKSVDELVAHITQTVTFFESLRGEEVTDIVYAGGSIRMPGLFSHLQQAIPKKQRIAQPIRVEGTVVYEYLGAVGMALRAIDASWNEKDVGLPLVKEKKRTRKHAARVSSVDSEEGRNSNQKPVEALHRVPISQVLILIAILILGAGTIFWAFSYRSNQRNNEYNSRVLSQDGTLAELEQAMQDLDMLSQDTVSSTRKELVVTASSTTSTVGLNLHATTTQQFVRITETGIGYVNVRSGPGTAYEQVSTLAVATTVELLNKENEWVEVAITPTSSGWVFGAYIEEVDL